MAETDKRKTPPALLPTEIIIDAVQEITGQLPGSKGELQEVRIQIFVDFHEIMKRNGPSPHFIINQLRSLQTI